MAFQTHRATEKNQKILPSRIPCTRQNTAAMTQIQIRDLSPILLPPAILPLLAVDTAQHHADHTQDHGENIGAVIVAQHQHDTNAGKADGIIEIHIHSKHPW